MKNKSIKKILCVTSLICSIFTIPVYASFDQISKGDEGQKVVEIQTYLIEQGFLEGNADGQFGNGTEGAVKGFQEVNGLNITGIIDEETYNLLSGNIAPEELIEIDVSKVRPITFDAGLNHILGLKEDGKIFALFEGDEKDDFGQCGIDSWENILSISAGGYYSLGLQADGTVVAVGDNSDGQCNIKSWTGIIDVAAGYQHSVGLKMDGTVVATGYNEYGQCNTETWTDIIDVAAGGWHTIGLRSDGTVVTTGQNKKGQCDVSDWTNIVAIDGGTYGTIGLKADGTVVAAGGDGNDFEDLSHWQDIINISIHGFRDTVYGIKSDGSVETTANSGVIDEPCMAAAIVNRPCFLMTDGSVKYRNSDTFSDIKLQKPYQHIINKTDIGNQNTGNWLMLPFVDEFNLPTDDYYVVNDVVFEGTFSNSATNNSLLKAYLFYSSDGEYDYPSMRLLEYGEYFVNNIYSDDIEYDIVIMDNDNNKYYLEGTMYSKSDVIYFSDDKIVIDALKKGGRVLFAITEKENSLNKYVVTIEDATGFDAIYYQYWNK